MSDAEGDDSPVGATPMATDVSEVVDFDINLALQEVLKLSMIGDGLARGLHEAVKALDKRQALMCVLAEDCDEAMYKKLVIALCTEHNIPLLRVDNNKKLGEWAGLCKIDKEGKARKVVRCSCVVIKDFGGESPSRDQVLEYIKLQDSKA
ncbi:40S ribosomal protein S12 [Folsomia candida]|uniref:40S ribosomal protein S12 n=1 Tax=Folsomia candida TaxID=158441 RepID=A0A226EZH0_FOLCA|nr:40S ribosomal protein S12 [Folsomia candida]OXA62076.1 hypothetical protein Fcan01_02278 [Folsomia candida]